MKLVAELLQRGNSFDYRLCIAGIKWQREGGDADRDRERGERLRGAVINFVLTASVQKRSFSRTVFCQSFALVTHACARKLH